MSQYRFSNLAIINTENDIDIDKLYFIKKCTKQLHPSSQFIIIHILFFNLFTFFTIFIIVTFIGYWLNGCRLIVHIPKTLVLY